MSVLVLLFNKKEIRIRYHYIHATHLISINKSIYRHMKTFLIPATLLHTLQIALSTHVSSYIYEHG